MLQQRQELAIDQELINRRGNYQHTLTNISHGNN